MANNFTGAAEIIGPYLHSNAYLFVQNANELKASLTPSAIGGDFGAFLARAKNIIVKEVKEQVDFLHGLETKLALSAIAKVQAAGKQAEFTDRESFLNYLNTTSETVNKKGSANTLIQVKEKTNIPRKDFNKLIAEIGKKILKPLTKDEEQALKLEKQGKSLNEAQTRRLQRAKLKLANQEEIQKNFKQFEKEVKKIIEKSDAAFKQYHNDLVDYYQNLVIFARDVIDGYVTEENMTAGNTKEIIDKKQMTAAETIFETARFLGLKVPDKGASKADLEKFKQDILNLDSVQFLSIFYSAAAVDYLNSTTPAFQMDTRLGELFEIAIKEVLVDFVKDNPTASLIFDDLKLEGNLAWLTTYSPLDLKISSFEEDGKTFNIGFSLKLRNEDTGVIKLDIPSDSFKALMNQRDKLLGTEEKNKLDYIANNLVALETYRADKENTDFFSHSFSYDIEEMKKTKIILARIMVLSRILVGLWNKVGDRQFDMALGLKNDPTTKIYYAAYLYDQKGVFSLADTLLKILNKFDFTKEQQDADQYFTVQIKQKESEKVSQSDLEKLYQKKLDALKKFRGVSKINYTDLYSDSGVSSIMNELNKVLSQDFFTEASGEVNIKKIKDL